MIATDRIQYQHADTTDERRMQIRVTGDGPPVALVGGGLTGWRSWTRHAEALASSRSVARLQPLNVQYGLENRPLPEGYSPGMESAALAASLAAQGWHDPLDLVAWSYGALIALDYALDHPDRVRTLTLIEPPAAWVLPDGGADDPDVQALRPLGMGDDVDEVELERFLRTVGLLPPGARPQELPQWPVWLEHRQSLRDGLDPLSYEGDPSRLRTFERPVLLVTGTGTAPFHRRIHDVLATGLPDVRAVEMPGGHAPHIVSMDRFMAELEAFHASVED